MEANKIPKKPNNVIGLGTDLNNFFKTWLRFLTPLHSLTKSELEVAACFIKHRYILSKNIVNSDLLDKIVVSKDIKKAVMEECNLKATNFYIIMSELRKKKFIVDGKIFDRFVPKFNEESNTLQLLIHFEINDLQ